MTLEQLRIFVSVAEREHMTRAAEALNLTQSAVSAAIAALEARHGVYLFHRIGRGIELTDVGRSFLTEARAVLGRAEAAEHVLADFGNLNRGLLSLVASQTIASYWLQPYLAQFAARFPGIEMRLSIANTEQAARQVIDGTAELGFVEGLIDEPALARWTVGEDELILVSAEPLPSIAEAVWLRTARWVLREKGSGTRSSFEAALRAHDIETGELHVAMTLPSNEAVRTAVENGIGISALSSLVVAPQIESGALYRSLEPLRARPFFGLRHKERRRSNAAAALLTLIESQIPLTAPFPEAVGSSGASD